MRSFHLVQMLARRIFSYYTLFCLLSLLSFGFGIAFIAERSVQHAFVNDCRNLTAKAEFRFTLTSLQANQSKQALASQIAHDKLVEYCALIDGAGRYLAHSDDSYIGTVFAEPVSSPTIFGPTKEYHVSTPEQDYLVTTTNIHDAEKQDAHLLVIGFKRPGKWSFAQGWMTDVPLILVIPGLLMLIGGWVLRRSLLPASQVLDQLSQFVKSPTVDQSQLKTVPGVDSMTVGWNRLVCDLEERLGGDLNQRIEDNLQSRQQDRWQAMFDSFPDGIAETNIDGKIILINNALASMLDEEDKDGLLGEDLLPLLNHGQEEIDLSEFQGKRASVAEISKTTPSGERTLRIARNPVLRDQKGAQATQLWSVRDVTQQKLADKSREEFLDAATHELRTPLSNIKAYAETLSLNEMLDVEQQKQFCNVINSEATRLARFIDELLTVSSIEAGSLSIKRQKVELARMLEEVVDKVQPQVNQKKIKFETAFSPKLPELALDKDKFATSLINLLGNAIKYTPVEGRVAIKARVNKDQLEISVEDSGFGISDDDLKHVFDKFFRSADERVLEETGSGLGLAFAHEVVQLHGGTLTVKSQLNQGSTFTVTMPVGDGRS